MSHPAPHRHKVRPVSLWLGLFGAPACWVMQMEGSEMLSSRLCYPHAVPLQTPTAPWLVPALAGVNGAALILALGVAVHAWLVWHKLKDESSGKGHVIDTGEGRTRFLAAFGLLSCGLFVTSIVLTALALILVSPCRG